MNIDEELEKYWVEENFYQLNKELNMNPKYSFWQSVGKTAVRVALVLIPFLLTHLPVSLSSMTIGGALMLGFDYMKARYTSL